MDKADVIIVGAGPAGSSLARLLARHGANVKLLEAAHHPRRKPCGESLSPGAVQALRRMGLSYEPASSVPPPVIQGWRLHYDKTKLQVEYPEAYHGLSCLRDRFDHWLVQEAADAGAAVLEGVRVERLVHDGFRYTGVQCSLENGRKVTMAARLIVGADGLRSTVARGAGLTSLGGLRKAAFTFHLEGVNGLESFIELHMRNQFVVGMAPVGNGLANLTVGMSGEIAGHAASRKTAFIKEVLEQMPYMRQRLGSARHMDELLSCGPFHRTAGAAAAGVLLVGDAAGYYDPLTGQGIYRALRSAELAAPRILAALQSGLDWPLYQYSRHMRAEFAPSGKLQRLIEYGSRHPLIFKSALLGLTIRASWRSRLAAVIGDIAPDGIRSSEEFVT